MFICFNIFPQFIRVKSTVYQCWTSPNFLLAEMTVFAILFLISGAERVLHLRLEMPGELPPLIIEMLDRTENVCIP